MCLYISVFSRISWYFLFSHIKTQWNLLKDVTVVIALPEMSREIPISRSQRAFRNDSEYSPYSSNFPWFPAISCDSCKFKAFVHACSNNRNCAMLEEVPAVSNAWIAIGCRVERKIKCCDSVLLYSFSALDDVRRLSLIVYSTSSCSYYTPCSLRKCLAHVLIQR